MTDYVLWGLGFFFLGVVVGLRIGVWWFTKAKPLSEQQDRDIEYLRSLPRESHSLPALYGDERPYRAPVFDDDGTLR